MKTAKQFDEWQASRRQRPMGQCSGCELVTELRQLEPAPLCGPCYMKVSRQDRKEADPNALQRALRKRERNIRTEMGKILNVADAVNDLIDVDDINELKRIAKGYLQRIIGTSDDHGHAQFGSNGGPDVTSTGQGHQQAETEGAQLSLSFHEEDRPGFQNSAAFSK